MDIIRTNIRAIRKKLGYTQDTVAEALGVARTTYTEYETKDVEIPFDTLEKLSDFFGVELASFYVKDSQNLNDFLVCAFRMDNTSKEDLATISHFKSIVKHYIQMKRIEK